MHDPQDFQTDPTFHSPPTSPTASASTAQKAAKLPGRQYSRDIAVSNISSSVGVINSDGQICIVDLMAPHKDEPSQGLQLVQQVASILLGNKKAEEVGGAAKLPAVEVVKRLHLADAEPYSDKGHFRFFPNGALMYDLLTRWHEHILSSRWQASPIKTPYIYRWEENKLKQEALSFRDELYYVSPPYVEGGADKESQQLFVLRFGGDFGLFSLLGNAKITYRNLPVRLYEFSPSFRYERSGNLRGIQRARSFSFFDIHSVCAGGDAAWSEFCEWFGFHCALAKELKIPFVVEFSATEECLKSRKNEITSMVREAGGHALIEVLSDRKHYWDIKYVFYDANGRDFFNNQLDFVNGQRFGIHYTTKSGERLPCALCHASLGSIERWIIHAIETAQNSTPPTLPLWLCPTQVRIIPVHDSHLSAAQELALKFSSNGIRTTIDDRKKTVGNRIALAAEQWCPYVIVFGDKEVQGHGSTLNILRRGVTSPYASTPDALIDEILSQVKGYPNRELHPTKLSQQPIFS